VLSPHATDIAAGHRGIKGIIAAAGHVLLAAGPTPWQVPA